MPHLSIRIDFDDEGRLGPVLTERGQELIRHYRAIERKALSATARHVKALQAISRSPQRK